MTNSVEESSHSKNALDNAGVSLPSPEEMRVDVNPRSGGGTSFFGCKKKKTTAWTIVILTCAVLLVVVLCTVIKKNGSESSTPMMTPDGEMQMTDKITAFLLEQGVSTQEDLQNSDSPQFKAVRWLATQDSIRVPLPDPAEQSAHDVYMYITRYVMTVNYFALDGENWSHDFNFLSGDHICSWNSLTFYGGIWSMAGLLCEDMDNPDSPDNLPRAVVMGYNNMTGRIPKENAKLTSLKTFDMQENNWIDGSIPSELCNLSGLTNLMLGKNYLEGTVPACLEEWKSLEVLYLSDNQLIGQLPSSIAQLQALRGLFLDGNTLSGDITFFNALQNLEVLYADNNLFQGDIGGSFVAELVNLRELDLSGNHLSLQDGVLSPSLLRLPSLEVLDLSGNGLSGAFPDEVQENGVLKFLGLQDNSLRGHISQSITNFTGLTHFDLSGNQISGTLTGALGSMTTLKYLFLANNPLLSPSSIPEEFASLTNLEELSLRSTNREGALPEFISNFSNLILLDLSYNSFNGTLPASYGNLDGLEFLLLSSNDIDGELPASFSSFRALRAALLDDNELSGSLDVLCELDSFQDKNSGDRDGYEMLVADCGDASLLNCTCCTCCDPQSGPCSGTVLPTLDGEWEEKYQRYVFNITSTAIYSYQQQKSEESVP